MKETIVYRTNNYEQFKRLVGNRDVNPKRVRQIKKSIEEIGYIPNPIIVNENMEVIDGQGRLQALKDLGLPVEYIIKNGVGIKECLFMNINQEKWKIQDYIKSYAEMGNENYKKLQDLIELYPIYSVNTIGSAVKGIKTITATNIRRGNLEISTEEYEKAIITLNYLNRFIPSIKYLKGKTTNFFQALVFIYQIEGVDKERLVKQVNDNVLTMIAWHDTNTAIQSIEEIYNKQLGLKTRVYIFSEYRKALQEKQSRTNRYLGIDKDWHIGDKRIMFANKKLEKMSKNGR